MLFYPPAAKAHIAKIKIGLGLVLAARQALAVNVQMMATVPLASATAGR
jgi:hypothetical protein